jgi:hypothetical protein
MGTRGAGRAGGSTHVSGTQDLSGQSLTSTYSFQWNRLLMYRRSLSSPLASRLSLSIEARKTGRASSSRKPGTSTLISSQAFCPLPLFSCTSSWSRISTSSSCCPSDGLWRDLSTSALTPTSASVPSSRAILALPFAPGSTSYSARMERKSRGPLVTSRRTGGDWAREERRNDSSAGDRLTRAACWGAMAGVCAACRVDRRAVVFACLPACLPAEDLFPLRAAAASANQRVLHPSLESLHGKLDAMRDNTNVQSKCRLLDRSPVCIGR